MSVAVKQAAADAGGATSRENPVRVWTSQVTAQVSMGVSQSTSALWPSWGFTGRIPSPQVTEALHVVFTEVLFTTEPP